MSSKERAERKKWRHDLTSRIQVLKFEIQELENRVGSGTSARRNVLESRILEIDLKIKETEKQIEDLER
ncbi:MAG: hypothetical protein KGP28_06310 [Bdellovibrionales bacterium]|nr:hypothetical protein [Bdellovibrionales bacterium]